MGKRQEKTETRGRKPKKLDDIDLSFESLEKTRADLTKLTIAFLNMEIPEHTYRAAVYGVNSITKLLAAEKMKALEDRIHELERGRK